MQLPSKVLRAMDKTPRNLQTPCPRCGLLKIDHEPFELTECRKAVGEDKWT